MPVLAYADVTEAAEWLCQAFGFRKRILIGDHRAQLTFGIGAVIVTRLDTTGPPTLDVATHSVLVRVEDADGHHDRALEAGARIVHPPTDYPYGERQ
jgi:uncharacterized glyoxalase superfamily protein PhnB